MGCVFSYQEGEEEDPSERTRSQTMSERLRKSIRQKLRPSIFTKSSDCSDCMLVEIGEKTSYFGEPCDKCGKYPRTPYHVNY